MSGQSKRERLSTRRTRLGSLPLPAMLPTTSLQLAPSQTASDLLLSTTHSHRFTSGCSALDELLSPPSSHYTSNTSATGLAQGATLELVGPPGVGKSRTAMGFALAARFEAVERDEKEQGQVLVVGEQASVAQSHCR